MKKIETKRYILRIPNIEDAKEIYEKWGTDKENMAQYKEHRLYRNVIEAKALINSAIEESKNGVILWIIESKENKEIVGYVKLPTGMIKDKKREVAFYFLKNHRKDGTAEEVLRTVIDYIFTEEEYETIITKFYAARQADKELLNSFLLKIGMKREGILRNRLINNEGEKIDKYIYSILKEEWELNKTVKKIMKVTPCTSFIP